MTPAAELRTAAQRLREAVTAVAAWIRLATPALAEPLAGWLEEQARQYDLPPCDDPTGVCNRCEWDPSVLAALSIARVINGEVA